MGGKRGGNVWCLMTISDLELSVVWCLAVFGVWNFELSTTNSHSTRRSAHRRLRSHRPWPFLVRGNAAFQLQ